MSITKKKVTTQINFIKTTYNWDWNFE